MSDLKFKALDGATITFNLSVNMTIFIEKPGREDVSFGIGADEVEILIKYLLKHRNPGG